MESVAYLENGDFNIPTKKLVNPKIPKNIPVVIMIQASWCPHCTNAKGAYQEFALKNKGKVFCATIEADGERESEKELGKNISNLISDFQGFPHYVMYFNGKKYEKSITGRSVKHLEEFANI